MVDAVIALNLNKTLFCLVVAIILLIFGTFMEGTAIAVLLVPYSGLSLRAWELM